MPGAPDAGLEWYLGEFWLYQKVFTVFRQAGRPGWCTVVAFDGTATTPVCEFTLDEDPIWSEAWQSDTNTHAAIAAAARSTAERPRRD